MSPSHEPKRPKAIYIFYYSHLLDKYIEDGRKKMFHLSVSFCAVKRVCKFQSVVTLRLYPP